MRPPVTLLYAPADRADRVRKAYGAGADVVIIDLEDAVAPSAKDDARDLLAALIHVLLRTPSPRGRPALQVRINQAGTPWHEADVALVAALPGEVSLRLPKAESPDQVRTLCTHLDGRPIHLLLESAIGIERAYELATCHPSVAGISIGEADLRAALGVSNDDGLLWARSRVVLAAAAAGLPAPAMSVFANVSDLTGLKRSSEAGRALGFLGRTAIHPRQLDAIRTAFTPGQAEIERAREVVAAADEAGAQGTGAIALPDGRFVDEAVVRQARRTLALVDQDMP